MDGTRYSPSSCRVDRRGACWLPVLAAGLAAASGCSQLIDPKVPAPLRALAEPQLGRGYLLYRPSHYDREYEWPLIIVCHTTFPDSPNRRIRYWTEAAESYGFLVAAPTLEGVARLRPPPAAEQLALQRLDEEAILSVIRHVQAGHNVSEDRIFIHGWSGGAYAALHTGLRHPEVFRAISLMHPKFNDGFLGDAARHSNSHQPIELSYSVSDAITGKYAAECLQWLHRHGVNVIADPSGGGGVPGAQRPLRFFERVVRDHPWLHIRALAGGDDTPLEIQFKLRTTLNPTAFRWDFGDGSTSTEAAPLHRFSRPGSYVVSVTVEDGARGHHRAIRLNVPSGTFEPAPATAEAAP